MLLWLNLDLLIHQMVQIRPAWAHFSFIIFPYRFSIFTIFFYILHLFYLKYFL